jgi:hypothetical protein
VINLKPKVTTPALTAAEAVAAAMRDAIATARKPAALEMAERAVTAAREVRAKADGEQMIRVHHFNYGGRTAQSSALAAEIRAGEAALKKCDETIRTARAKLDVEREAFRPALLAALAEPMGDAAAEIAAHLAEIETLVGALSDARRFCERSGIEAPRLLAATHVVREHVASIRRTIGR